MLVLNCIAKVGDRGRPMNVTTGNLIAVIGGVVCGCVLHRLHLYLKRGA